MPPGGPPEGRRGRFLPGSRAHLLYNLALAGGLLATAPAWIPWVLLSAKRRRNFGDRLGVRGDRIPLSGGGARLWIHGVSVGETLSAVPLVRALRDRLPDARIVFSTVTLTGQEVAAKALGGLADGFFYFPFDLPGICGRFLDRVRPDAVAILETEIWPNFLAECARRRIPVVLLNGRISERSLRGYGRFRFLFSKVLSCVSAISAQTEEDALRITSLGADPARVQTTGNMKFDIAPPPESRTPFRTWLLEERAAGASWFVAGSTHEGEEEAALAAFARARRVNPRVRLLVAPRHPERFASAEEICGRRGWEVRRRSRIPPPAGSPSPPVVLLDTVGELLSAYSAADIAFVGGSLVPKGGHNILEPALYGVPTLAGPHMENFREIAEIFTGGDALLLVRDAEDLAARLAGWAADPAAYREMGVRAKGLLEAFRGATAKNVEIVVRAMSGREGGGG
jgi:3-deoxy-D-manno-octulosonic-acid transferase